VDTPPAVAGLAAELSALGWVTDLFVGGSLATGDYRPGVSDLDLVALTDRPLDRGRRSTVIAIHRSLDTGIAAGADLGCTYVAAGTLPDRTSRHPTWTHGELVDRRLSGIARAELVRHGFAVFGRPPQAVLPGMSADDVRRGAQAELTGYWASAVRHPWWWLDPSLADLGLTSMARGRHALATGDLITKTGAIDAVHAPARLRADLHARRDGAPVRSPRLRTAWVAWRDARRTTAAARRWRPTP
jgi:Nucleotidyltransferase domain